MAAKYHLLCGFEIPVNCFVHVRSSKMNKKANDKNIYFSIEKLSKEGS